MQIYLVEHYHPGFDTADLRRAAARVRAATAAGRAGASLLYLGSTVVPSDEAFLSLFEAGSEREICEAYARAGIRFERITKAESAEGDALAQEETRRQ